jgi:beta propeller repeat protein
MHIFPPRLVLALCLFLTTIPILASAAQAYQVKPRASAPTLLAGGPGNQDSPSLVGDLLVYDDCTQPFEVCGVHLFDLKTRAVSTLARTDLGGTPHTDGAHVVWRDAANKTSDMTFDPTNNLDVYALNLTDYAITPVSTAPQLQNTPYVFGNIVVWTDYRIAPKDDYSSGDIYMRDLTTGRETAVSTASGYQSDPVTNGKVVVWSDLREGPDGQSAIYGYDMATRKEFLITRAQGPLSAPAIWGNTLVWYGYGNNMEDPDIFGYDLITKKEFPISTARGSQVSPAIWGNLVVWEDWRNNESLEGGLTASDIYGYDLISKQEFPIAVGGDKLHTAPTVSGNTVVWVDRTNDDGTSDIMSASITNVASTPGPQHPQVPTNKLFRETGKSVSGAFLEHWLRNGGLAQQGFPISDPMQEVSDLDGKSYKVQYFERAVFEEHPQNKPPYNVLLSQLGTFRYRQKYPKEAALPPGSLPGTIKGTAIFIEAYGEQPAQVYAIPVGGGSYYAVGTWYRNPEFTLSGVEPGDYYLLAYYAFGEQTVVTAYTKAVACLDNQRANCPDHSLIPVTVRPSETVSGIKLSDNLSGYYGSQPVGAYPPQPTYEGRCRIFRETGKKVCGALLQYWLRNGDLSQQGFPLSNTFTEVSELDGRPYTVQYFERAVFELHPENAGTRYEVLLSQLGTFQHKQKYGGR